VPAGVKEAAKNCLKPYKQEVFSQKRLNMSAKCCNIVNENGFGLGKAVKKINCYGIII